MQECGIAYGTGNRATFSVLPALTGFNYLKNASREYRRDMEDFSQQLIAAVELQHRKPDYAQKTAQIP